MRVRRSVGLRGARGKGVVRTPLELVVLAGSPPGAMKNLLLSASALVLCCMRLCWQWVWCVVDPVGMGFSPEVAAVRCR